eukprot:2332333-Rhodomonas_salina.1
MEAPAAGDCCAESPKPSAREAFLFCLVAGPAPSGGVSGTITLALLHALMIDDAGVGGTNSSPSDSSTSSPAGA